LNCDGARVVDGCIVVEAGAAVADALAAGILKCDGARVVDGGVRYVVEADVDAGDGI